MLQAGQDLRRDGGPSVSSSIEAESGGQSSSRRYDASVRQADIRMMLSNGVARQNVQFLGKGGVDEGFGGSGIQDGQGSLFFWFFLMEEDRDGEEVGGRLVRVTAERLGRQRAEIYGGFGSPELEVYSGIAARSGQVCGSESTGLPRSSAGALPPSAA